MWLPKGIWVIGVLASAGILYTSRPRGDIGGVARFVDEKHKLCCEMEFGKVANAGDALLQRPDALSGSIFRFRSAASQKNTSIPVSITPTRCWSAHCDQHIVFRTECHYGGNMYLLLRLVWYYTFRLNLSQSQFDFMSVCRLEFGNLKLCCNLLQGKRELKSRGSLSGLANALSNALSGHSSSQVEPEMMREETFASCSGNWLSHLDWDGHR